MNDLRALTDAFAELERRADAATAGMPFENPRRARSRHAPRQGSRRLVPVAAAVVAVAGLATGAVLLAPGGDPATQNAAPPATSSTTAPPAPTSEPPSSVPVNPAELAERFRAVLGDTATFTVTESGPGAVVMSLPPSPPAVPESETGTTPPVTTVGSSIVGTLTASGVTGGFDLVMYPGSSPEGARCDSPDDPSCTVRVLPDGSTLATGQTALEGLPNGMTYLVNLVRPDGVVLTMHLSNRRSPKGGATDELGPRPPLTIDQMVAIATSDRW